MPRYTKKPITIEAREVTGGSADEILEWVCDTGQIAELIYGPTAAWLGIAIHTLEGTMDASPGDWVIRGVKGEFYPCKPDIFAESYEAAE